MSDELKIVRLLGRGGMGEVSEVERGGLRLALKRFTAEGPNREFLLSRFRAEGELLMRLSHPNLVRVHECGEEPDGMPFYLMDLVLGADGEPRTLESVRLERRYTKAEVERWFTQLRDALAYCHAQGVVHRDVKLENVLVNANGDAVLGDFGVARITDDELRDEMRVNTTFVTGQTTGTKPVMGTFWYLAPEVRRGGKATVACDWYALGVLFFRLLTGMWYEPETDAFDLLEPSGSEWRKLLEGLLSPNPEERERVAMRGLKPRKTQKWWWVAIAGVFGASLAVTAFVATAPSPSRLGGSRSVATAPDGILRLGEHVFHPCPAGTNTIDQVRLVVTRPYWLAEVPVTWAQWKAVTGSAFKPWPGGENAPATYMTYEEMCAFCEELTKRHRRDLPKGYVVRLPTLAEWRLACSNSGMVAMMDKIVKTAHLPADPQPEKREAHERELRAGFEQACQLGRFGSAPPGVGDDADLRQYYLKRQGKEYRVKEFWPEFPPQELPRSKDTNWVLRDSQFVPTPVGLKAANSLGLRDMWGNCFEMLLDRGDQETFDKHCWFRSEWGGFIPKTTPMFKIAAGGTLDKSPIFKDMVLSVGKQPLMVGEYMTPYQSAARPWISAYDRTPYLGFRLCVAPPLGVDNR